MEQLRLTLPELEQEEQGIRENLGGLVKNFVFPILSVAGKSFWRIR